MNGRSTKWVAFELRDLTRRSRRSEDPYLEFISVPALNAGLYTLEAGATDYQRPHGEDELYYVISGRGRFSVDGEDMEVGPGTVLYVKAGIDHRFHSIAEDLAILVVFSSAESP